MNIENISNNIAAILIAVAVWTIPWKGVALWRSARNSQKIWFFVLLVVNTVGILEILYLLLFSKKKAEKYVDQK